MKLIDYCTKMPTEDSEKVGHAFPFNACEILCTENGLNIEKLMDLQEEENESDDNGLNTSNPLNKEEELKPETKNEDEKEEDTKKEENEEEAPKEETPKTEEGPKEEEATPKEETKPEDTKTEEDPKEETKPEEAPKEEEKPKEDETPKTEEEPKKEEANTEDSDKQDVPNTEETDTDKKEETEVKATTPKSSNDLIYSLFDHLFAFLDSEPSDDNYVLMGYFNKIVNNLLNDHAKVILTYIFQDKPEIIPKLVKHIGRKAIGNVIESLINSLNEEGIPETNTYIANIAQSLLEAFEKEENDSYELEVATDVLINTMITAKKSNFIVFLTAPKVLSTITSILEKLIKEKKNSKTLYLVKMLIKLCEVVLKDFSKKVTPNFSSSEAENEIVNLIRTFSRGMNHDQPKSNDQSDVVNQNVISTQFETIFNFLSTVLNLIISDLVEYRNTETITILLKDQPRLGMKSLYEWELFRSIIDILINAYHENCNPELLAKMTEDIAKSTIFERLLNCFFTYTMNNMFQNIFIQIITIIVSQETPSELVESLLMLSADKGKTLIDLLMKDIIDNHRFIFDSKKEMNSCLFANDVQALKLIADSQNKRIVNLFSNTKEVQFFCTNFVSSLDEQFQKKLLLTENLDSKVDDISSALYETTVPDRIEQIKPSMESIDEMISYRLELYDLYVNGKDYESFMKAHDDKLKEKEEENVKENNEQQEDIGRISDENDNLFPSADAHDGDSGDRSSGYYEGQHEEEEKEEEKKEEDFNDVNYWTPKSTVKEDDILSELGL